MRLTLLYAVPFVLAVVSGIGLFTYGSAATAPADDIYHSPATPPPSPGDDRMLRIIVATVLLSSCIAVVGGWITAGRVLRPLRAIIATAQDISANSLNRRLGRLGRKDKDEDDEFTDLAETLDSVFERLEAAFASQRRFVANASHELRTPLAAERALLQVALADPDATVDTLREACQEVLALGAAQERLVDALLTLASGEQGVERDEPVDLAEIAAAALRRRADEAKVRGVRVDTGLGPAVGAGDPRLAESLVANLVDNAVRHNVDGGWVEVSTATVGGAPRLTVRNTGAVVPADEVERLLQPFQRLEGQRIGRRTEGHGLGLAIVQAIATAHGAALRVLPRPEGGLDVTVDFRRLE
ncbi:HAMP domain-containing histidine kinase [Dactylosporangium aurantiacum]|uniref:histidine kinase n=2 Tax=Dactylosporangium aurantiacum TaxID=35754 RepID=A0A9Q9IRC4_9ACTN|nr:HAMP domain-containing histidine kinase [Dactylosporangium aurantiacum]